MVRLIKSLACLGRQIFIMTTSRYINAPCSVVRQLVAIPKVHVRVPHATNRMKMICIDDRILLHGTRLSRGTAAVCCASSDTQFLAGSLGSANMSLDAIGGSSRETFSVYRAGAELDDQATELLQMWKKADKVVLRVDAATGVSFLDIECSHPCRRWTDDERLELLKLVDEIGEDWTTLDVFFPGR